MSDGVCVGSLDNLADWYDLESVRLGFPALQSCGCVYLDNAATSFCCQASVQAWQNAYLGGLGSPGRGSHALAALAKEKYESTRSAVAGHLGTGADSQLVFVESVTAGLNLLAYCLEPSILSSDLILATELEHHSNYLPWMTLARRTESAFYAVPVTLDGDIDQDSWYRMLDARPKVVALSSASNVTGHMPPIRRLVDEARAAGAIVVVDGAQHLPNSSISFVDIGCDFLVVSAHKMGGPRGIAAIVGRTGMLDRLSPAFVGGGVVKSVSSTDYDLQSGVSRFEPGTRDVAMALAWEEAFNFWSGYPGALQYLTLLGRYLRTGLESIRGVSLLPGGASGTQAITSFILDGIHPHDLADYMDRRNICIRTGHMCAQPLVRRLGHMAVNRVSISRYTSVDEVNRFLDAIEGATNA
ncbi:MAG: aminotransferase class V-fold PLP-dependent enzyme [Myxococcota bacterium]|jgi:cysteine desulfurase/selenocysteine lyase